MQLPPLAATQQAQQEGLPAADSCAQQTAAAAAELTEQAAAAAEAVALQQGAGAGEADKPLLLRMEPMVGCLTTCEAGASRSLCRASGRSPLLLAAAAAATRYCCCHCCCAAFGAGVLVAT